MSDRYTQLLDFFSQNKNQDLLSKYRVGIERESLRTDHLGNLSQTGHPKKLGSSLKNSYISTDFSEAQLELISPAFDSIEELNTFLNHLHAFTAKQIEPEWMWPLSMPCKLPKKHQIPIAKYGSSDTGLEKEIYRRGLVKRYGINMQLISGIHFNFSFSNKLMEALHKQTDKSTSYHDFINDQYFHVTRNYLHFGWLVTYLFGCSPLADKSYFSGKIPKGFVKLDKNTYLKEDATSLRMSVYGYYNKTKCQHTISLDNIHDYIKDLEYAINTPCKEFESKGVFNRKKERIQLNTNLLQIPNEHYTRIRPKPVQILGENSIDALKRGGVSYLEIRSIDIDPADPIGITKEKILFLHLFLVFCLLSESHSIKDKSVQKMLISNQDLVGTSGNQPNLMLKDFKKNKPLTSWGLEILTRMQKIIPLMPEDLQKDYQASLENQLKKIKHEIKNPSQKLIEDVRKKGLVPYALGVAKEHKQWLFKQEIRKEVFDFFAKEAALSFEKQRQLESYEDQYLKGYEDLELSTQVVLKECFRRGHTVTILDREANIIKISSKKKEEIIKQATITKYDSYLSFHLMENKHVTKRLLQEAGICTPKGIKTSFFDDAKNALAEFKNKEVVIKPTHTNFGLGISFVKADDKQKCILALKKAFSYGSYVLIEEYIKGDEYRILIINNKVIAILKRDPANVVGDGIHTIEQLVEIKNSNPKNRKTSNSQIKLLEDEIQMLNDQNLTKESIPKKSQKVFLRKNSNVSTGGDSIDMTDTFPDYFKQIALQATQILGVTVCGVDMLIPDLSEKKYSIIEMNFNPNLAMHYYPYRGKRQEVGKAMLDFLKL